MSLLCCYSVSKSRPPLWPHGLQHTRLVCPLLSPGICLNSCPLSQWCYLTISSLCHPLLLLPSIFLSIRVFCNESALHIRWPKYQSFSFSIVLPMNIQGWFPLGLTGLQYIYIYQIIIDLMLTQCYMLIISQSWKKKKINFSLDVLKLSNA